MMNRLVLRAEGLGVIGLATLLYGRIGGAWLWFGLLFLLPDLSMVGYLAGKRAGAVTYNLFHTYLVPFVLLAVGYGSGETGLIQVGLIWAAHIGMDRLLGYGLKYETGFKDTHLHRV